MARDSTLGEKLITSLQDALAYQRGEMAARTRTYARRGNEWILVLDEVTTAPAHRKALAESMVSGEELRSPRTPTE